MQKAVFLLIERGTTAWKNTYKYHPFNWGPYCRELTDDLHLLISSQILVLSVSSGVRYGRYQLTDHGQDISKTFSRKVSADELRFIGAVRSYVTNKDFNTLLKEVYDAYPEYAEKSVWVGRK